MVLKIEKAEKTGILARIGLMGPPSSGKTWSALAIATALGGKIGFIDTEKRSSLKYAGDFDFDVVHLDTYEPENFLSAIDLFSDRPHDVLIVDSLSHAWAGTGGILDRVNDITARSKSGNTYAAWREGTPLQNKLIDSLLAYPGHVIVCLRSKVEYVLEANERGKMQPRKVGMAPIQREGLEYEFDIVGEMDYDHKLYITKTRCKALDGKIIDKPGQQFADVVKEWISSAPPLPRPLVEKAKEAERMTLGLFKPESPEYAEAVAKINEARLAITGESDVTAATDETLVYYLDKFLRPYYAEHKPKKKAVE